VIDIVHSSKKASSFIYCGERWWRQSLSMNDKCVNDIGEVLVISPLRRSFNPYAEQAAEINVMPAAQAPYQQWLARTR